MILTSKGHVTDTAHQSFLQVDGFMILEVAFRTEPFVTGVTLKNFLFGVSAVVTSEVVFSIESFIAHITNIDIRTGFVCDIMHGEVASLFKLLAALFTVIGRLLRVDTAVVLEYAF